MLSKEEIEKYKNTLEELASDENVYNSIKRAVAGTFKYITQLESDKQKLIDKLEERKFEIESKYSQINGNYFMKQDELDLINEILSIVKGEKHG